tara:strand:+ start:11864 stop:13969 length:2106 start_codon:yes stop_codon:yes gene_type:complete
VAVFTAIATAIVGAIGITGVLATIATSIIAGGLAYGTARALGVFKPPSMDQGRDPGVTIQLPPATDNKLPILYGNVFTSGPIFDAAISNENKTMTYCIALSEETQTGTFSCSQIFMNDTQLVFSGNTVVSHIDPNQSTATTYAGNVRVNIYQGGSSGSDVIFPASGTGSSTAASAIVPHWGVNHTANAMVFAVMQIDYDAENGLTGLPQMTFKMKNTLSNPGDVLYDYLTSSRYGAGLSNDQIDVTSITGTANTAMKGYSAEQVTYRTFGNVSTTHDRYEINGMLSTFDPCATNIDKICQAAGTFFSFNVKEGKFKAIPNRELSTAEKANCLVYNDDNIVSKIDISSTELYALYNGVEVEFADNTRKDQTNTVLVETPGSDRNPNEPDNILNYKLDMINDNMRAERLANIDLNQSRVGTVIQFVSDFSGIQSDVGDVIKVTNDLYGWTDKLFRVMRVTEQQDDTGMVTAQISAIEYSDGYYVETTVTETTPPANIDIPKLPVIGPIFIGPLYNQQYGNITALPGDVFGNVIVKDTMQTFGAGAQIEDQGLDSGVIPQDPGTQTFVELTTPAEYDIRGVDIGDFTFNAFADHGGSNLSAGFDAGFKSNGNITFANATTTSTHVIGGGGMIHEGFTTPTGIMASFTTFSTDPTANTYNLPSDFKPVSANVVLEGFSDAQSLGSAPRKFDNMSYQIKRITKGEK